MLKIVASLIEMEEELDPLIAVEKLFEAYENAGMIEGRSFPVAASSSVSEVNSSAATTGVEGIRDAMEGLCLSLCLRGNEFRVCMPLEKLIELICASQRFTNDARVLELAVRALAIIADTIVKGADVIASGLGGGMELILTLLGDLDYIVQHKMLMEEMLQCLCAVTPRLPCSSVAELNNNVSSREVEANMSHLALTCSMVRAALAHQIVRLHEHPSIKSSVTLSLQCLTALEGLLQGDDFGDASRELKQFWRGALLRGFRDCLEFYLPDPDNGPSGSSSTLLDDPLNMVRTASSSGPSDGSPGSRSGGGGHGQQWKKEGNPLLLKYLACLSCYCDRIPAKQLKEEGDYVKKACETGGGGYSRGGHQSSSSLSEGFRRRLSFSLFGRPQRKSEQNDGGMADPVEDEAADSEERNFLWHVTVLCATTIRRSAAYLRGETGDMLRSAGCSPLLALYGSAPDLALFLFERARVMEVICVVAVTLLEGMQNKEEEQLVGAGATNAAAPPTEGLAGEAMRIAENEINTLGGVPTLDMSHRSSNSSSNDDGGDNENEHIPQVQEGTNAFNLESDRAQLQHLAGAVVQHQEPAPVPTSIDENANGVPVIASELSVLPLLEFLLVLLPPPRSSVGHADFANVTVPFFMWVWEDQFSQPHTCGERLSVLLEMAYQSGRFESPQMLLPLFWRDIQERHHEDLSSHRQQAVDTDEMNLPAATMLGAVPCVLQRQSLLTGYVHGRLNGLRSNKSSDSSSEKWLQCRCTRHSRLGALEQQMDDRDSNVDCFSREGLPLGSSLTAQAAAVVADGASIEDDLWRLDGVSRAQTGEFPHLGAQLSNDWNVIFDDFLHADSVTIRDDRENKYRKEKVEQCKKDEQKMEELPSSKPPFSDTVVADEYDRIPSVFSVGSDDDSDVGLVEDEEEQKCCCPMWRCCTDADEDSRKRSVQNVTPKMSYDYLTRSQLTSYRNAMKTEAALKMVLTTCVPSLLLLVEKTVNPLVARHCAVLLLRTVSLLSDATNAELMLGDATSGSAADTIKLQPLATRDEYNDHAANSFAKPFSGNLFSRLSHKMNPATLPDISPERQRLETLFDAVEPRLLQTAIYLLQNPVEGGETNPVISVPERVSPFRVFDTVRHYREHLSISKGISTRFKAVTFTFTAEMRLASADIIIFLLRRKRQQHLRLRQQKGVSCNADDLLRTGESTRTAGLDDSGFPSGGSSQENIPVSSPKPPIAVSFGSPSTVDEKPAQKKNHTSETFCRNDDVVQWISSYSTSEDTNHLSCTTFMSLIDTIKTLIEGLRIHHRQIVQQPQDTVLTSTEYLPSSDSHPLKLSRSQLRQLVFFLPGPSCPFHGTPLSLIRRFIRVLQVLESSAVSYVKDSLRTCSPADVRSSPQLLHTSLSKSAGFSPRPGLQEKKPSFFVLRATIRSMFQQELRQQTEQGAPVGLRAALALYALIHSSSDAAPSIQRDPGQISKIRTTVSSQSFGSMNSNCMSASDKGLRDGTERNPYTVPQEEYNYPTRIVQGVSLELLAEYYPDAFSQAADSLVRRGQCFDMRNTVNPSSVGDKNTQLPPTLANDLAQILSDTSPPLVKEERKYSPALQELLDDLSQLLSGKLQFITPDQGFTVLDGQPSRFTKRKRAEKGKVKGIESAVSTALYVRLSSLSAPEQYLRRFGVSVEEVPQPISPCISVTQFGAERECAEMSGEKCNNNTKNPVFFTPSNDNMNNSQSRLSERSCSSFRNTSQRRSNSPSFAVSAPQVYQINVRGYSLKYVPEGQPLTFLFLLLPRTTLASLAACLCNRLNSEGATNLSAPNQQASRRFHCRPQGEWVSTSGKIFPGDSATPSSRPQVTPRHILFLFGGCPVISPLSTLVDVITFLSPKGVHEVFDFQRVSREVKKKHGGRHDRVIQRESPVHEGDGGSYEVAGVNIKLHHISFLILSEPMPSELYYSVPCGCRAQLNRIVSVPGNELPTSCRPTCSGVGVAKLPLDVASHQHFCNPAHFFRRRGDGSCNGASKNKLSPLWSLMEALVTTLQAHSTCSALNSTSAAATSRRSAFGVSEISRVGRFSTGTNCRRIYSSLMHLMYRSNDIFILPSVLHDSNLFKEQVCAVGAETRDETTSSINPAAKNERYKEILGGQISMVALWTHPLIFSFCLRKEIFYVLMQCQRGNIFPRLQRKRQEGDSTDGSQSISTGEVGDYMPPAYAFQAQNLDWLLDEGVNVHTQRISVEVTRSPELVVPVCCGILQRYASCPLILDFSFRGEPGIGLGPALEYFESFAKAIETDSSLGMWRTEEILSPVDALYSVPSSRTEGPRRLEESTSSMTSSPSPIRRKEDETENVNETVGENEENKGRGMTAVPSLLAATSSGNPSTHTESPATETPIDSSSPKKVIPLLFPCPNLSDNALSLFFSLGLFLGRMLYMRRTTSLRFHPLMLKVLRDNSLLSSCYSDASKYLQMIDPTLEHSLRQLESMSDEELLPLDLTFVLPGSEDVDGKGGEELKPNGQFIHVSASNVKEYTMCVRRFNLDVPLQKALLHLRNGMFTTVHPSHLFLFSVPELDVLLSGKVGKLWESPQDLARCVVASHGYTLNSRIILDFLHVVTSWSASQQRLFLQFLTGCSTIGSSGLQPPITIVRRDVGEGATESALNHLPEGFDVSSEKKLMQEQVDGTLPSVSTCFHYLKLPQYSCREVLEDRLFNAITDGQGSFDLS